MEENSKTIAKDTLLENGTLFALNNGKLVQNMKIEDIFDTKRFTKMKAVTYSASPEFINQYLNDFKEIKLVVGIQEKHVQRKNGDAIKNISRNLSNLATHAIAKGEVINFINSLDTKIIKSYVNDAFTMYVPIISAIHAKIYLLSNDETGETRIIKGSANLSNQAFNQNIPQIEDIDIIDNNDKVFEAYDNWFDNVLLKTTIPYIADNAKEQLKEKIKVNENPDEDDIKNPSAINIIHLTNDDEVAMNENLKLDYKHSLETKFADGIINDRALEALRNPEFDKSAIDQYKQDAEDDIDDEAYGAEVITEMISRQSKVAKFIPDDRFKTKMKRLRKIHVQQEKSKVKDGAEYQPYQLVFDQTSRDHGSSGIVTPVTQQTEDGNKTAYYPYGQKANHETIKYGLETIDMLLQNYKDFIFNYDDDYGKEIMELILYSFTGPFLWEIRQHLDDPLDCPQFLFVGGAAGSGKSSLVELISQMMGYPDKNNMTLYSSILPDGISRKKSLTIDELSRWTKSDKTIAPLLIDEVPEEFFSKTNYGYDLVKNVSNTTIATGRPYPIFIGTTNSVNYSFPPEIQRRAYYLSVNHQFKVEKRQASRQRLNSVMERINDDLFKDFVLQMASIFNSDEELTFDISPMGKVDFLSPTRKIFKKYYKSVGMKLPNYFPETRYDNSISTGRSMWRNTFEADRQNETNKTFIETPEGDAYLVNKANIDVTDGQYQQMKTSEKYANALPQGILVPDGSTGNYIKIYKKPFLEWINSTDVNQNNTTSEHKGFFAKLFNK